MPLDNRTDPGLTGLSELSPDLAEFRDVRAPAEMIQLGRTVALAGARHEDLLKFRRTWGGAFADPDLGAETSTKPIDRAAIYPTSHILHFSVLAALVLFEGPMRISSPPAPISDCSAAGCRPSPCPSRM